MLIEAINEQLLRAIGVGVALLDLESFRFRFYNDTFSDWFGAAETNTGLDALFPDLDLAQAKSSLAETGAFTTELNFRHKRRPMAIAASFSQVDGIGNGIVVLVCQNISRIKELELMIDSYSMMVERNTREIKREKEQTERLLLNIMPKAALAEYRTFGLVSPRTFADVSVVCVDFFEFASIVERHEPAVVVSELNDIFSAFDRIGEQFGCERIRTVGDNYVSAAGMPDVSDGHPGAATLAALRFLRYVRARNETHPISWSCRIGLASGKAVGSVVGVQKYVYDAFGPAFLKANRLRLLAEPMTILANESLAARVRDQVSSRPYAEMDIGAGEPERISVLTEIAEKSDHTPRDDHSGG